MNVVTVASGLVLVGFGYIAAALIVAAVVRMSALFPSASARSMMLVFCVISAVGALGTGFAMLQGGELGGFATLFYAGIFVAGQFFIWPWSLLTWLHMSRTIYRPPLEAIEHKVGEVQKGVDAVKEQIDGESARTLEYGDTMSERVTHAIEVLEAVHFLVREVATRSSEAGRRPDDDG